LDTFPSHKWHRRWQPEWRPSVGSPLLPSRALPRSPKWGTNNKPKSKDWRHPPAEPGAVTREDCHWHLASSLTVHTPFTSVGPRVSHDVDVDSGPVRWPRDIARSCPHGACDLGGVPILSDTFPSAQVAPEMAARVAALSVGSPLLSSRALPWSPKWGTNNRLKSKDLRYPRFRRGWSHGCSARNILPHCPRTFHNCRPTGRSRDVKVDGKWTVDLSLILGGLLRWQLRLQRWMTGVAAMELRS
jgi:hypothetical protein